ncbi:RNA polymerase sigma factor [Pontibacter harenae]|uniref:RNA polymerase sigma factor n=1 Tax=Pontibacter harenae TaxID=2894083 RepID=UPI001E547656|nr:sigma-70 family RNA polymerase sigma factor [Pontibacter harenae]MCC9166974.1 sigma-70 family RNA polymerase sigma factor [Pontibacter harenae]
MMNELQAWENLRKGSEAAFSLIYRRHAPLMLRYGHKLSNDSDIVRDSVQQVYLNVWNSRERLGTPVCVRTYLLKALRRELAKRQTHLAFPLPEEHLLPSEPPYEATLIIEQMQEQTQHVVRALLSQLLERQREAIFLRYFADLNAKEIAQIMGIDQTSVYKLIYKALDNLNSYMNKSKLMFNVSI